jgi:hypothetical protein
MSFIAISIVAIGGYPFKPNVFLVVFVGGVKISNFEGIVSCAAWASSFGRFG